MEFEDSDIPAVRIRNAYKKFKGSGQKGTTVLRNFSMTVNTGTLYSLIGSSGCGKTTILSCLMGIHKLDRGYLSVFGSRSVPVSPNRWQRIGYMPQELSLYTGLTIFETLSYFGALFDTGRESSSQKYLAGRMQFLKELLSLPNFSRKVGTLSGGEKRRVSFAVALINEPELLLLDEPTSGVDPLVRECIWQHLRHLAAKKGTTIIVTTHYIDEARGSNIVGMMRDGRLIAEDDPTSLLNTYQVSSLEGVFLALCRQQNSSSSSIIQTTSSFSGSTSSPHHSKAACVTFYDPPNLKHRKSVFSPARRVRNSGQRITALVTKNFRIMVRSLGALLFVLAPVVTIIISCAAVAQFPRNISMGVVNHDVAATEQCLYDNLSFSSDADCSMDRLSCCFLREIPAEVLNLKLFPTTEEAHSFVEAGEIWGYISFPSNYSAGVTTRMTTNPSDIPEDDMEEMRLWDSSKISVRLDQTSTMIRYRIVAALYKAFENSAKRLLQENGADERIGQSPLQFGEPLVGNSEASILAQLAPGLSICMLILSPITVSVRYITEKRQGTMDRCIAAGTQVWEILVAHAILEAVVLTFQSFLIYCTLFYGFQIGVSIIDAPLTALLAMALCVLSGLTGLAIGLLLGVLCKEEAQAAMFIVAIIFPINIISGVFWPTEGMPSILQTISMISPLALPFEALRVVMSDGADFFHVKVWPGFMVLTLYTLGCNLIIILLIRLHRAR